MGEFVCRVADANGRIFSHIEAASSVAEARQKLAERGLYVYAVDQRNRLLSGMLKRPERSVSGSDFLILNQQFNTLIKAGLPILRALDLLADRASSPKLRPVISQVRDRVREGKSLSEAVAEAGAFSKVYSTAILAGEKSGNLSGVLDYYIAYQRVSTGVRKKILATLVYPVLLILVASLVVTYLVAFVVPKFGQLYRDMNVELPIATKILIAVGIFLWSRSEEGGAAFDRLKFRLPLIGDTSLKFQVAQFCRTLATLLTGGTPLVAGLQTAADSMDSALLRGSITRATQMVREGDSLNAALASTQIMPALALDMIEVGESSGALAPMLTSVAEFYEEEVNIKLSAMVSLIEPAILVFMGILVAFILISLYLP